MNPHLTHSSHPSLTSYHHHPLHPVERYGSASPSGPRTGPSSSSDDPSIPRHPWLVPASALLQGKRHCLATVQVFKTASFTRQGRLGWADPKGSVIARFALDAPVPMPLPPPPVPPQDAWPPSPGPLLSPSSSLGLASLLDPPSSRPSFPSPCCILDLPRGRVALSPSGKCGLCRVRAIGGVWTDTHSRYWRRVQGASLH